MLAEAEQLYRKILQVQPRHVDSLHLLGVAHHHRGAHEEAVRQIDLALKINPNFAAAHSNRGNALKELKRFDEALAAYDRALALDPKFADAPNNRGVVLHEQGRFEEALAAYDQAVWLKPDYAEAFNNRGNALKELNRLEEALKSFDRAIALKPDFAEAYNNRAAVLRDLKHIDAALASYDKAIALSPHDATAYSNRGAILANLNRYDDALASLDQALALGLDDAEAFYHRGNVLSSLKRYEAAVASYDQAIARRPNDAVTFNSRGVALAELKRFDEALASYDRAIVLKPDYVEAINNRGVANKLLKRFDAALADYDKALALAPDYPVAVSNRGNVLKELKRFDEALKCYDKAIGLKPDYAEAFNNRGITLNELRRFEEALAAYDRTIALKPDFAEAHVNRGIALNNLGRLDDAVTSFGQAIALKPDYAEAFYNRANTLNNLKRYDEAVLDCERALALKSDQKYVEGLRLQAKMQVCRWDGFEGDSSHLVRAITGGTHVAQPFTLLPIAAGPAVQRRCAELFIADRYPAAAPVWRGERYGHERIRVGYVSGDLREHPVAVLAAGLFEHHDRSRFETIAISFGSFEPDRMTERLKGAFERFIDVRGQGDREIAALLRELEIDIAVDLNGVTGDARPNIFAARPAPVQVNYLGYAGTLGANYWDYIVADRFVIPEELHDQYGEQVVSLPGSFMPNDDGRKISTQTPSRREAGLPEHGFVFCCFNNSYKFTPDAFEVWMRLLREVEGSVLWLSASNPGATQNLRREAEKRGVPAERLIFARRVASNEDHLARLKLADLFLDTLYYNAHTTACDALWAGLPLITHPGQTFASRVAGSLLTAVGLPELIAPSLAEYEALALQLAREPEWLAAIREKLVRNRTIYPLFNTDRFTRHMEAAYRTMWERAQRGEPPQSFAVDPGT